MEWLASGLFWGIVSAAVAFISIALAVFFYFRPRELPLDIGYRIEERPLVASGALDTQLVSLHYGDLIVEDPWVWAAELINVGKRPLKPGDFDGPLYFEFPGGDAVVQVQTIQGKLSLREEASRPLKIGFEPQVLNAGERAEIVALVAGKPGRQELLGKLAGVLEIRRLDPVEDLMSRLIQSTDRAFWLNLVWALVAAVAAALYLGIN